MAFMGDGSTEETLCVSYLLEPQDVAAKLLIRFENCYAFHLSLSHWNLVRGEWRVQQGNCYAFQAQNPWDQENEHIPQ